MRNNVSCYKKAIELLMVQKDWRNICVAIAQKHPKIFIEACPVKYASDFDEEVVREYKKSGPVPAIKYIRNVKGWGLVESKRYYDALKEKYGL